MKKAVSGQPDQSSTGFDALRVLIACGDEGIVARCRRELRQAFGKSAKIDTVAVAGDARSAIGDNMHDVYIFDYDLVEEDSRLIRAWRDTLEKRAGILLMKTDDPAIRAAAADAGVADCILKSDLSRIRLERSVSYALALVAQERSLGDAVQALEAARSEAREAGRKHSDLAQELEATQERLRQAVARAEESERRYRHLARHDALTGLPNRMLFAERLRDAFDNARRGGSGIALLQCDLDRFRHINDTMGHQTGDYLLSEVARRIDSCVHAHDTVARFGGDEFIVLLANPVNRRTALQVAERIVRTVGGTFELNGLRFNSGITIGIALLDASAKYPEDLIYHADLALGRAKEEGGPAIKFFDNALSAETKRLETLKRALGTATHRQELYLEYQPKVDLRTGEIRGVEALARWQSPTLGKVSPAEFIPVAEASGDILMMSEWVLDEAARMAGELRRRLGRPMVMSVNVSPLSLKQGGLPRQIEHLVARYGIEPDMLEAEITETSAVENLSWASDQLQQLRDIGVSIAIDDFGTGYSSLAMATKLPADVIKIDRAFVSGMLDALSDAAAVKASVSLAHSLGMYVIAEGVETGEQLNFLDAMKCDGAQGYLIGRPMSADALVAFCQGWRADSLPVNRARRNGAFSVGAMPPVDASVTGGG